MILRSARRDDLDAVAVLEERGFDHARWSRQSWADELSDDRHHVVVATDFADHVPELLGVAAFSTFDDTAELLRVVVRPERRGERIGEFLTREGFGWAKHHGARRMMLEVEETNAPAKALYDRVGFSTIARRDHYYGTGAHALVMQKELDHE